MTENQSTLEKLSQRLAQINADINALEAAVEAENRQMTPDEIKRQTDLNEEFDRTNAEYELRKKSAERAKVLEQPLERRVHPLPTTNITQIPQPGRTTVTGGSLVPHSHGNHGFAKGFGEFLVKVRDAKITGHVDPRLMVNAVSSFGGEGVPGDGGYALPPDFARGIMDAVMPEESFLRALNPVQTNSNLLQVPVNENAAWSSSGVTSAKTAEGAAITQSKPELRQVQVVLHKFAALVSVSEEALSDIPFLSTWVAQQMAEHLRYQMEDKVVNGTGMNEPLGFLNAPGLVAISDADSTASAIGAVDVLAMRSCLLGGAGAFWIANPTVYPAIATMKTGSAGYPLFQPDITVAPRESLLGMPFYRSEACQILNTTGDLFCVVPSGYILATKAGGVQTASTIGFAFDQDLQSFRATLRFGGAPVLSAKVARAKSAGSSFASHIVALTGGRS